MKNGFRGLIPSDIIKSLKANKCILFVGSGLSSQVKRSNNEKLPNWENLLKELLNYAILEKIEFFNDPNEILGMIDKGNLLMAAQELQERVGNPIMGQFFDSIFRDSSVIPSKTHRILPHIPFRAILTTNYDSLIEGAYTVEENGKIPAVFTQEDLFEQNQLLYKDDFFIFKIHGDFNRPSTIVLSSRDYQEVLFRTPGYRHFIETLFATYMVVFVGFSGNDPDITNILDKLSSIYSRTLNKHYILLPQGTINATEKRRFLLDRRLEVVEYIKDNDHTQVTEFLKEIQNQIERIPEEKSGSNQKIEPYHGAKQYDVLIFISGSSEDRSTINRVSSYLKDEGYSTWTSSDIKVGSNIIQEISEAIDNADCVIIISSNNSEKSEWVRTEKEYAMIRSLENKSYIIPVVLDNYELPEYLRKRQYLKLKRDFTLEELIPLKNTLSKIKREKMLQNTKKLNKWADYCISAVNFNTNSNRIKNVEVREDYGDTIGNPIKFSRTKLIESLESGMTFVTIINNGISWNKGETVNIVVLNKRKYIKIDKNRTPNDDLGNIPQF
ncbi:MAG: toll/interleukin-1 receptor domain-containing protein [Methanobacterium paludis]|nr:toll/interleukin-1 receptor domain-containing protein [Methanobacterium paludis]